MARQTWQRISVPPGTAMGFVSTAMYPADDKGQCTAYDATGEESAGAVHCPYLRILHTIAV